MQVGPPQPRSKLPRGFPRDRRHEDFDKHGREVSDEIEAVARTHRSRPAVLGVDPRLIVVFELDAAVDPAAFSAAELAVLDYSGPHALVAFSDDEEMGAFQERVAEYRKGVPDEDGRSGAAYESVMDAIVRLRPYGPDDRLTERLKNLMEEATDDDLLLVDVECWYPGDQQAADSWLDDLELAVDAGDGEVLDRYLNPAARLVLARIQIPAKTLEALSELDVIAELDAVPVASTTFAEVEHLSVDSLPTMTAASSDAPLVGVVDSGVQSAHPLLADSVYDAVTLTPGLPDGEDRHGHGTAVASRVLIGDPREVVANGTIGPPSCRILSVRVLDERNLAPESRVWAREIENAVRYCAESGARIVNLSVGDPDTPHRGPKSTPVAALVDQLIHELGLVVVVPTGNVHVVQYCNLSDDLPRAYVDALAKHHATTMIDPAPAALALTVGGAVPEGVPHHLPRKPLGKPGWVSPISRTGPGIENAIKPELVAPAGTQAYDRANQRLIDDSDLRCVIADLGPDRVLATHVGTSYAAPEVTRTAAAVLNRYPSLSGELVRALVLQSSEPPTNDMLDHLLADGPAKQQALERSLVGYGQASPARATNSTDHRTVLVAEAQIAPDESHLYEVPIPQSFFESGGIRGLSVSLAYSTPTRVRRLDYLASRMQFEVVRGLPAEDVVDLFMDIDEEEDSDDAEEGSSGHDENEGIDNTRLRFSDLSTTQLPLKAGSVSRTARSRGAHQHSRRVFSHRLKPEDGESFIIGVKSLNRWASTDESHPYGLAVTLWRDLEHDPIYAELESRVRERVEVPVEIQT